MMKETIACGKLIHQIFAEPYVEALYGYTQQGHRFYFTEI